MQVAESMEAMAISPDDFTTVHSVEATFEGYQSLTSFIGQTTALEGIDPVRVAKFIVLLYSEDSILNTRPPKSFDERQAIAAKRSGFEPKDGKFDPSVQINLFDLADAHVFEFVFEYLTKQKKMLWIDIITLESQMLENVRVRLSPVTDAKAAAEKDKLLNMFGKHRTKLGDYYDEFYGDNDQIRAIHQINRDNMATLENFAI